MNEEIFKQYPAFAELYKNAPDVKAADGHMLVEITRGNVIETHKATSFFFGAKENSALLIAQVGDLSKDHLEVEILSQVTLKPGRYELRDDVNSPVIAFYIYTVKGDPNDIRYYSIGNGILNVTEVLIDPLRPHIKGTIEFMCRETPVAETWMKVVAKDFWVDGDLT
jgi:hypothetical protein